MINGPFPSELEQLVQVELTAGKYQTPVDVLLAGVRLLQQRREMEALRSDIQAAIEQGERGEYIEFDEKTSQEFLASLILRAEQSNRSNTATP